MNFEQFSKMPLMDQQFVMDQMNLRERLYLFVEGCRVIDKMNGVGKRG